MPTHAEVTRHLVRLQARWREIFCSCGADDPMCLGCAVLKDVLRHWGTFGLDHMISRVDSRERSLHTRIAMLETQLELLRPRGFLED